MILFFKKYVIAVCVCAAALPVVVSTIYVLIAKAPLASTITGLFLLFAMFIVGFVSSYNYFERKAQNKVEALVSIYNVDCDPARFISESADLVSQIVFPCKEPGAWFMGFYGQALLDVDEIEKAKTVQLGIQESIYASKKPSDMLGVLVNLVSLESKLEGTEAALKLVDEGISICADDTSAGASSRSDYLVSQKEILESRLDLDQTKASDYNEKIMNDARFPMRVRVECAWAYASCQHKLANPDLEREALAFVIDNGNKLSLVGAAQNRISNLS